MHLTSATVIPTISGLSRVRTGTLLGLDLQLIDVEVALRRGPPHFELAGLAETSVREARIRVGSALSAQGLNLEEHAITVSLAPAHLRKGGGGLDLALATAILQAAGHVPSGAVDDTLVLGELALDGTVRSIAGVLPLVDGARRRGLRRVIVPQGNIIEASHVSDIEVLGVEHLGQLRRALLGEIALQAPSDQGELREERPLPCALEQVRGQWTAKRALLIAAAGQHHLLLVGPPGAGKSLLARALPGLLPPLERQQSLETTAIHSVAGLVDPAIGLVRSPPFRSPHHSVSEAALVGGGQVPRPGEMSLAHHGVLFLDELPEFRRSALEALRTPLEDHQVRVSRARYKVTFPARPLLVCAMNPCPCGHFGDPCVPCSCAPRARRKYLARISGPLLERLDLHLTVQPALVAEWARAEEPLPSPPEDELRKRVLAARDRQTQRARARGLGATCNSDLSLDQAEASCQLNSEGRALLATAAVGLGLSARSYVRVLRVARTIADLAQAEVVEARHLAEALQYRMVQLDADRLTPAESSAT